MTPIARLAAKNADFYRRFYHRTTALFTVSVLYLLIGVLFFASVMNVRIVLDTNPHDGVETAAQVLAAVDAIMLFFLAGFCLLFLFGILRACHMLRIHRLEQEEKFFIYSTVGMTRSEFQQLLRRETRAILFRAFFVVLLAGMVLWTLFSVLVT